MVVFGTFTRQSSLRTLRTFRTLPNIRRSSAVFDTFPAMIFNQVRSKCPFLTRVSSAFLRKSGPSFGIFASRCPVMGKVLSSDAQQQQKQPSSSLAGTRGTRSLANLLEWERGPKLYGFFSVGMLGAVSHPIARTGKPFRSPSNTFMVTGLVVTVRKPRRDIGRVRVRGVILEGFVPRHCLRFVVM